MRSEPIISHAKAQPRQIDQLHATEARWFAVYTSYKREKQVLRYLEQKQIHAYLPLLRRRRRYGNRLRETFLPLISCYIFVRITRSQYVPVLETPEVLHFVRFSRDLIAIPDPEIELLRRVVGDAGSADVEAVTREWRPGDAVEVIAGELTGLRGRLIEQKNRKLFVVDLETLGYELRIEIEPALLRPQRPAGLA